MSGPSFYRQLKSIEDGVDKQLKAADELLKNMERANSPHLKPVIEALDKAFDDLASASMNMCDARGLEKAFRGD